MVEDSPRRRARRNLTGIVSVVVTGVWLAALVLGYDWWLAVMLFGYVVVVPLVAMLFGDEADVEEWWGDDRDWWDEHADTDVSEDDLEREDTALATLRERYARGELTDEQFERKVERLLENDTLEHVEERERERTTELE